MRKGVGNTKDGRKGNKSKCKEKQTYPPPVELLLYFLYNLNYLITSKPFIYKFGGIRISRDFVKKMEGHSFT